MKTKALGEASKMVYVSRDLGHSVHLVQHTAVESVYPLHSTLLTQLFQLLAAKPSAAPKHLLCFDSPASTRHPADSRTCCFARRLDLEDAIIHTSKVSSHSTHDHQLSNTGGIPSVQCLSTINLGIPFWAVSKLCLPQWHENEICVKMRFKLLIGSTCSTMFL